MNQKKGKNKAFAMITIALLVMATLALAGCEEGNKSDSGATKAKVDVPLGPDGLTNEQRNVKKRIEQENDPNVIHYLYVVSAYTGQIIYQSTVDGKVTSSGKRLNPYMTDDDDSMWVKIGDNEVYTNEIIQDDGTFGESIPYFFWWDINGNYHQQFDCSSIMIHISNYPIEVKDVVFNMDILGENSTGWK
jgi:hypothetical protein